MIAELGFQAQDFQPIAKITLKSIDQPVLRRLLDKYPDLKTVILKDFLEDSNDHLAKHRDDAERNGSIWIGRGKQREDETISLFADFEVKKPNRVTQKCLGGIVGALSGTRNYETEAWLKKQLKEEEEYLTIP